MPLPPDSRVCLTCETMLAGRIDKKFCNDYCRSMYNNKEFNSNKGATIIRKVNSILRKNRRILEESLQGEKTTLPKQKLVDKGFNFNYFTSQNITRNNHTYKFCYEYGYLPLENDFILIVKRKAE